MIDQRAFGRLEAAVEGIDKKLDQLISIDERLRATETAIAHDRGRNSIISAVIATGLSIAVAFTSRHWA